MKRVYSRYSDEQLQAASAMCHSMAGVLRTLGVKPSGGSNSHYKRRIEAAGIDISHFTGQGHNKGKVSNQRRNASSVLVLRTEGARAKSSQLVRALLEAGIEHACTKCRQGPEWYGNPLTLDVDHINENWLDDRLENLRFLCPNCHSQYSRKLCMTEGN